MHVIEAVDLSFSYEGKTLLGFLKPLKGTVRLFGEDVRSFRQWHRVGYVPQRLRVERNFPATVGELLELTGGGDVDPQIIALLHLNSLLDRQFLKLSGGQQQIVLLGMALVRNPDLLLLDEPTAGLDVHFQKHIVHTLKSISSNEGRTVLMISHDIGLVLSTVDRMELLSYDFVQRGLAAGLMIAVSSALTGVFLILRRMAFLGAGLSHAAFGGVALSMVLGLDPLVFTAVFTLGVGNLIQFLSDRRGIPGDAAIIFSGGVALAVLLLGIFRGFGEYVFGYLFGNILMVTAEELIFTALVFAGVLLFFALFYRRLFLLTFSEEMAKAQGIKVSSINHLLVSVASLVVVLSMKAVGVILASSMVVIPALTALMLAGSFRSSLLISAGVSVLSVALGVLLALSYDLPPSGAVVGMMILFFALAFLRKKVIPQ